MVTLRYGEMEKVPSSLELVTPGGRRSHPKGRNIKRGLVSKEVIMVGLKGVRINAEESYELGSKLTPTPFHQRWA